MYVCMYVCMYVVRMYVIRMYVYARTHIRVDHEKKKVFCHFFFLNPFFDEYRAYFLRTRHRY